MDTNTATSQGRPAPVSSATVGLRDRIGRRPPKTSPRAGAPRRTSFSGTADLCVFIGRFEPQHIGHDTVIREGLNRAQRLLILVGSANEPRTGRNPFTADERITLMRASFSNNPRLDVRPLEDSAYNLTDWIERAHQAVRQAWVDFRAQDASLPEHPVIALIGHAKDVTSYYLNLFPQWHQIEVAQEHTWSATDLRDDLFGKTCPDVRPLLERMNKMPGGTQKYLAAYTDMARSWARGRLAAYRGMITEDGAGPLSLAALDFLDRFLEHPGYATIAQEYAFVAKYAFDWRHAPYTPTFLTGDAVVVQSGYVLMVRRDKHPGKGLWALPGGFIEPEEPILDGALRELLEETRIDIREKILRKNIVAHEVFDAPMRSSRGRTVTHAYLIHLDAGPLPATAPQRGEVQEIRWVPLAQLDRSQCFEDHYSIIKRLTAHI